MFFTDVAKATGQHNGLVVATHFLTVEGINLFFIGTKVTQQRRAAEFVVKSSAAQWPFDHDIKGADNPFRFAKILFPGLFKTGDTQVGNTKTRQPCFRAGADTRGAFIADLTA